MRVVEGFVELRISTRTVASLPGGHTVMVRLLKLWPGLGKQVGNLTLSDQCCWQVKLFQDHKARNRKFKLGLGGRGFQHAATVRHHRLFESSAPFAAQVTGRRRLR